MGYIGIYNTTFEDFIIGKVRKGCYALQKMKLNQYYGPHFEYFIESTEYLGEIVSAKGFLVIGYRYNYENEPDTFLVEFLSKNKKKRFSIDVISEEKVAYHGSYKISHRFAGGCDCSIIPDPHLAHLCDRLVIISNKD